MSPTALYHPRSDQAAYQLRYSWTGWPSSGTFSTQPTELIDSTKALWEADELRLLEHRWLPDKVQLLFSATPDVSPVFVAMRAKGRLDRALRQASVNETFSRKVAVRSLGDNTRRDVEAYVERQVPKQRFADERFAAKIAEFTTVNEHVDLKQPSESARGRYWYNLHLVLVVEERQRIVDCDMLRCLHDGCDRIAVKKGHAISRISVMLDHLHLALRPTIDESPLDVVSCYQNNLAYVLGQKRIWNQGYYVGTFSEYTTQAVRNVAGRERVE